MKDSQGNPPDMSAADYSRSGTEILHRWLKMTAALIAITWGFFGGLALADPPQWAINAALITSLLLALAVVVWGIYGRRS